MPIQADIEAKPALLRNKRLIIALLFAVAIAAIFWSLSRVPALNEKAQMGLRTNISSIAFDIVLPVADDQPIIERVARSTVNWLYTNWKGMTFGLLFAAAALTILGSIKQRSFRAPWLNTVSGMFFGAPLGVCVNCATPIAQGMYAAGTRLETALATLISSPMLNPIVLSMMFTLLPWEMAVSNVLAVLILLSSLPVLVHYFGAPSLDNPATSSRLPGVSDLRQPPLAVHFDGEESYLASFQSVGRNYFANLLYILRLAVPLMLLAGALGALAIELAPFDQLSNLAPVPSVLIPAAILATFLPVPMAFNVIVVLALQSKGMHPGIGAVLLFSLSAFSIYPATIIAKFISVRLSLAIVISVVLIATALGLVTTKYFDQQLMENRQAITSGLSEQNQTAYRDAMSVCNSLPDALQLRCFSDHIRDVRSFVAADDMCEARPDMVDLRSCQHIVELFVARELAVETSSNAPCRELGTENSRALCNQYFVLRSAVRNHDISSCDQLVDRRAVQACRVQYLNASLLFNPDDSVCKGLQGTELSNCKVNARVYRFADTLDFEGCQSLPPGAQEHCRWITATTLVGRSNDASGCAELESPVLQVRCSEHVTAWRATKAASFEICDELTTGALKETCLLRVANRKIATILTDYSLSQPFDSAQDHMPEIAAANTAPVPGSLAAPLHWQVAFENADIRISHVGYEPRSRDDEAGQMFSKVSGRDLGLERAWEFRVTDFFEPFIIGKGIASGDFNNDGWPDLVLASENGALFYKNVGGRFQLVDAKQGILETENLFLVALVDADNDGRQDLFASAYGGTNYLLLNRGDDFEETELKPLEGTQRLTLSAGFADLDQDGDIDIALGNWSSGVEKLFSPEASANAILFRENGSYKAMPLNDIKGETNSVLIADINGDGQPDVLFGNDRTVPDVHYFSSAEGLFEPAARDAGNVPVTSMFTMSLDTADFNNDLQADLFSTDMTFARSSNDDYCEAIIEDDARARCAEILEVFSILSSGSAAQCNELSTQRDTRDCYLAFSVKAAKKLKNNQYCENIPQKSGPLYSLCQYISAPIPVEQRIKQDDYVSQVQRNVLLLNNAGQLIDQSEKLGVSSSFWSWNAKAADLDNDGWQDIYIGNGFHFGDSFYEVQANVLFRNMRGQRFEDAASAWGLDDTINTPSYTYLDFDLDGDVDIVATGVLAPPRVYINQQQANHSITFLLRQDDGNSYAIGAKVSIEYQAEEIRQQRKEIKLSGGFLSFDNPVAHFGLGAQDSIDSFSVTWPDGHISYYDEALEADHFYLVERK